MSNYRTMKPYFESDGITIFHGDCLNVAPTLTGVDAVITDPPYGINYQSAWRIDPAQRFSVIHGDDSLEFSWAEQCAKVAKSPAVLFAFCRWDVQQAFYEGISKWWLVRSQVIWDRGVHGLGDLTGQFAPCHDVAWFAVQGKWTFPNERPQSVYRFNRLPANELLHPTQKPLNLMRKIIRDLSKPGDTIFDPFMGSGTTGLAALMEGRRFIGVEIDEHYCDVARKRLKDAQAQPLLFAQDFSAKTAENLALYV